MKDDKKLIIGLIAMAVVILAGVLIVGPSTIDQNQTAYEIPLKTQAFSFFDMATPEGSNFTLKNNHSEVGKGMCYWENTGKFANETDSIIISKNYTDMLITASMKLVMDNGNQKIYMIDNAGGDYYKIVKTINDTDIIVSGYNLPLMEEMIDTAKVNDTSNLTLKEAAADNPQNNTTANNTTVEKQTVEKNDTVNKTEDKTPVEKNDTVEKTENKTPLEKVIDERKEQTPTPQVVTTTAKEPLGINGGSITTGSGDEDRTYARIYISIDRAGETVGTRIYYFRDGSALNNGNYVEATIKDDGYITIASADAYAYYPDFVKIELYDASENLQDTQGVTLEPTSGTQYF